MGLEWAAGDFKETYYKCPIFDAGCVCILSVAGHPFIHSLPSLIQFYDDRGNPTSGSHDPDKCAFVHPGSRAWNTASRPRRVDSNMSSRPPNEPSSSFRASGSGSSKSRDNSFNWNHSKGTSDWGKNDTSKGWETSGTKTSGTNPNSPPTTAAAGQTSWADAINSVPKETSGWGSTGASSAWGSQGGGGWGNATEETTQKEATSQTNPTASALGKEKTARGTEGPNWSDAGSGNLDRDRRNKGNDPDVVMEDPPPPVPPRNPFSTIALKTLSNKPNPEVPRSNDVQADRSRTESFSPSSPTQLIAIETPRVPFTLPKFKTLASMSFVDGTGIPSSKNLKGYTGRLAWFKKVVL